MERGRPWVLRPTILPRGLRRARVALASAQTFVISALCSPGVHFCSVPYHPLVERVPPHHVSMAS